MSFNLSCLSMTRTDSIALVTIALLSSSAVSGQKAFSKLIEKTEFSVPSESRASTLFTKLDPNDTGLVVDNAYDDPEMWGTRYREYMGGSMGSGIAAGDYDGDGKLDLYVSTKTKPGRLFRNLGDWRFEDVTEEAGLAEESGVMSWLRNAVSSDDEVVWRQGAVFADIDNDGDKDLYVCRNGAPNLLYVNQGDGTFEEEGEKRGLGLSDGSVLGAFADYDRDGWLDVLVLTNQMDGTESNGRLDRLYRNTGGGLFVETTKEAGVSGDTFGHAVIWFDYNEDLWPDFYIANDYAGPDYLYRNNGDGSFTNVVDQVAPHTSYSTMGLDTADVDNNGHIDIFLGDMAATSRETEMRRKPAASKEDLLRMGGGIHVAPQYTRNSLLLNMGTDSFWEAACWAELDATDWTWSVRFEDFDNDGWMDLHVTNGMVREANNSDLLARMMQARSMPQRIAVMNRSPRLEESNLAFRSLAGGRFEDVTKNWGLEDVGVSFGAAMGDFDRDGDMDIVYLNHGGGLSVYRNDVAGGNRIQVRLRGGESNRDALGALVKVETRSGVQVRDLASARGYSSGSELVTHFGLGSESEIERLTVQWPLGGAQVFEKLDANFAYLIEEEGAARDGPVKVQGEPLFVPRAEDYGLKFVDESGLAISDQEQFLLPFRTDRHGPALAVGDVDGNGREDVYVGATTGSAARLLLSKDGGYEQVAVSGLGASAVEDGPVMLFDANGDGAEDLLVTKASAKSELWPQGFEPLIYSNDGKGKFSKTNWLPRLSINVGAAALGDVDGDGDLDLFLGARSIPGEYPASPRSFLLLRQGGRFVVSEVAGLDDIGLVKSALFRDIDMDGRPDLIAALEWDTVRYFRNAGGGVFEDRTEAAGFDSGLRGWWNGLASGDFNGDGRLDFAVGNLGLNTTYEASREAPASLYYGPFGASNQRVIAEAVYEDGTLYPLRARGDIGSRLGHALRRFPRSDDYAKATLEEVFGVRALDAAEVFEADSFLSGVFLSQEGGRYEFSPFPPRAQIGPILGLLAEDFDGDGYLDVFASQNTDVATPSFHGGAGLFLAGKGDGRFEVLEPSRSGVSIQGNGRAAVVLDAAGDGKPGVFSTRHRGESVYLENKSNAANWLAIHLTGSATNPNAVGAQLMFVYEDGYERIQEVGSGGGWMSQGSALLWVAHSKERRLARVAVRWTDGQVSELSEIPENGLWEIVK
ncbi:VCBS repeat-containing protein [Pelagicoccus sp. NFK12]|uniref:VCBS repeat-containing protein n=1 Tax=Pelagicoccus enzymogenes TaxID=2773457 RepID=A0A927F4N4_9BACT|nr:VCBS repeat-containing protein [Pelagicoccus enzymogenes]